MRVDGQLPGRGHRSDAEQLGDAAALREVRLQDPDNPILDHAHELETSVVILAGRQRYAAERGSDRIAAMIVSGKRLFEPAHVVGLQSRHHLLRIGERISCIGINENRQLISERLAHGGNALEIAGRRVTEPELHRFVAGLDKRSDLIDERTGLLEPERDSAGVGRDRPGCPTE